MWLEKIKISLDFADNIVYNDPIWEISDVE